MRDGFGARSTTEGLKRGRNARHQFPLAPQFQREGTFGRENEEGRSLRVLDNFVAFYQVEELDRGKRFIAVKVLGGRKWKCGQERSGAVRKSGFARNGLKKDTRAMNRNTAGNSPTITPALTYVRIPVQSVRNRPPSQSHRRHHSVGRLQNTYSSSAVPRKRAYCCFVTWLNTAGESYGTASAPPQTFINHTFNSLHRLVTDFGSMQSWMESNWFVNYQNPHLIRDHIKHGHSSVRRRRHARKTVAIGRNP